MSADGTAYQTWDATVQALDALGIGVLDRVEGGHLDDLMALYAVSWWTDTRTRDDVVTMLETTPVQVVLRDRQTGRLIGFTRVLTNYVYKALIFDVIVDPARRGEQLGRHLMNLALGHPRLAGVKSFELYCRAEMVPFYRQWGFETGGESQLMRLKL